MEAEKDPIQQYLDGVRALAVALRKGEVRRGEVIALAALPAVALQVNPEAASHAGAMIGLLISKRGPEVFTPGTIPDRMNRTLIGIEVDLGRIPARALDVMNPPVGGEGSSS